MSLLFKKDHGGGNKNIDRITEATIRDWITVYREENVPFNEAEIRKQVYATPRMSCYKCKKCGQLLLFFGESTPRCPDCNASLFDCALEDLPFSLLETQRNEMASSILFREAVKNIPEPEKAEALLTRAIAYTPDHIDSYYNRAEARIRLGKFNEAIADCSKVIALNPEDWEAYLTRGAAKAMNGDHVGCISDSTVAIEHNVNKPVVWYNRGMSYLETGQTSAGKKDLEEFLLRDPKDSRVIYVRCTLTELT